MHGLNNKDCETTHMLMPKYISVHVKYFNIMPRDNYGQCSENVMYVGQ